MAAYSTLHQFGNILVMDGHPPNNAFEIGRADEQRAFGSHPLRRAAQRGR